MTFQGYTPILFFGEKMLSGFDCLWPGRLNHTRALALRRGSPQLVLLASLLITFSFFSLPAFFHHASRFTFYVTRDACKPALLLLTGLLAAITCNQSLRLRLRLPASSFQLPVSRVTSPRSQTRRCF